MSDYYKFFKDHSDEKFSFPDWPECGGTQTRFTVEELYQAIKDRLLDELEPPKDDKE